MKGVLDEARAVKEASTVNKMMGCDSFLFREPRAGWPGAGWRRAFGQPGEPGGGREDGAWSRQRLLDTQQRLHSVH